MLEQEHDVAEDAVAATTLFRGNRWPRALARVNKRVLVPDTIRGTAEGTLVRVQDGDRAIARACRLPIVEAPDGEGHAVEKIHISSHVRAVPGARPTPPAATKLFDAAQLHSHAAALGTADALDVVGVMVDDKREVYLHPLIMRVIQTLLLLKLHPLVDAALPRTALAYRPFDGVRNGAFLARSLMRLGYVYGWNGDAKSFYDSIKLRRIVTALPHLLPVQDSVLHMIEWMTSGSILRGPEHPAVKSGREGTRSAPLRGLYQGSTIAPLLSNVVGAFYFDIPFAIAMKGRAVLLRFADDFLMLARDAASAAEAVALIRAMAAYVPIEIHDDPSKTSLAPVDLRSETLRWLGYDVGRGGVRLSDQGFVKAVERIEATDPRDRRRWSSFVDPVLSLTFDPASRLEDLRHAALLVSGEHAAAVERAIVHVKNNIRQRWIANMQRFADPVLRGAA